MAKSLRSKVKRSYRSKKRDDSVYSATEAARLNRLNAKLKSIISTETGNEENNAMEEDSPAQDIEGTSAMEDDSSLEKQKRISTHGPRGSRREEWRLSKGMPARRVSKGMNRQGGVAAKRNAGRSKRRR